VPFGSLWLPVLASGVVVFVASSVLHMALTYHRADYKPLPDEDAVRAALGKGKPTPGQYHIPYCADSKQMAEPAMKEKFVHGPVALVTVLPNGAPAMGGRLALWLGFCVLVSFVAAYVARHTLSPGADRVLVMRIIGAVAFTGYGLAQISDSIWKAQPWPNTVRALIDALVYSTLTGLTFMWLWPKA
jgi:hypothetical protein